MREPEYTPEIKLLGANGNAFAIMGTVKKALLQANADKEYVQKYMDEAMSKDYDHLLMITMKYVDIA